MDKRLSILYISKLRESYACGVTIAVLQLFEYMYDYANVIWLDLGNNKFEVDKRIIKVNIDNYLENNIDIAVFEDPFNSIKFCQIAKELKKRDIPYILFPHGCFHNIALKRKALKKFLAIKTVFKRYLNQSIATQFLTTNEMDNSINFNTSFIVPNGIHTRSFLCEKKQIKKIVFIGRKDVHNKGIDILLEAVLELKEILTQKGVELVIYGSKESDKDEAYINSFIKDNFLEMVVTNEGPIFAEAKEKILMESDIFIQTSRHEGFPMSILEALTYGLPVIVTDGTNLSNIINEHNAGVGVPTTKECIVDAIECLINCDDFSLKSKNAYNLGNSYSWDSVCKKTVEIYSELVREYNGN